MNALELTAEQLRRAIKYDPDTGLFCRHRATPKRPAVPYGGSPNNWGHLRIFVCGNLHQAHRLAWLYMTGEWPIHEIDHVNGTKSDNRWANLRDVDRRTNQENQREAFATSQTGVLGVSLRDGKYWARIKSQGKMRYLGTFDTSEEAHAAYVQAKRLAHAGCTL